MRQIARFAIRRPVPILIFWVGAFVVALFFAGNARDNLHETQPPDPGHRRRPRRQADASSSSAARSAWRSC